MTDQSDLLFETGLTQTPIRGDLREPSPLGEEFSRGAGSCGKNV